VLCNRARLQSGRKRPRKLAGFGPLRADSMRQPPEQVREGWAVTRPECSANGAKLGSQTGIIVKNKIAVLCLLVAATGASPSRPTSPPKQPAALVESLYRQVVARHPSGIPSGANWKVLAPYLSTALRQRIDLTRSCQDDWLRQNDGRMVKAPFAWSEAGLFSGANERTGPMSFQIERTESKNDGSFLVFVRLRGGVPPENPWNWRVADHVVMENERPLIDDVIYLKDGDLDVEYSLSDVLMKGCNGGRWVGFGDQPSKPKQQE
jgi:hypothetical protein